MNEPSMIEELVLLDLMGAKEKGASSNELCKNLKSLTDEKTLDVKPALARLCEAGHIEEIPRAKRQRSSRWRLKDAGRNALVPRLGGVPTQGRLWKQRAARTLAIVRVLGSEPHVAAAMVKDSDHTLPAYFLAMRMGEKFHPGMTVTGLAERAAAAALNVPNGKPKTLWRGLFQRGITSSEPEAPTEVSLAEFAAQVKGAARSCKVGWFGPRKLFIHYAWLTWQTSTGKEDELSAFKQQLLRALRAGLIELSRADFTASLEPSDLADGATPYGNEIFHFVTIEPEEHA